MSNAPLPLVSIIIANYNHVKYLREAYESIQAQTYQNIEILFVDDGSTDGSVPLIKELVALGGKFPVRGIYLEQNRGKWFALNTAIAASNGSLVTLQDADDASCPTRIERQVACLIANGSVNNLCLFHHCYEQEDMNKNRDTTFSGPLPVMTHKEVTSNVYFGYTTPGINHFYIGQNYEAHGASCLFYKQLWKNGMKFLPSNLELLCLRSEDADFNVKMTLLLQKTSILLEKQYLYRRNTTTNPAPTEGL